ncbi:hypothetical protein D3C76_1413390 [compost metagenome]
MFAGAGQRIDLLGRVEVGVEFILGGVVAGFAANPHQETGAARIVGAEVQTFALFQVVHRVGLERTRMHV